MKTVLAVILAAALIAGALYVRSDVLDGENLLGGGTADGQVADGEEAPQPDEDVRVACDAVLGDGCPTGATRLDVAQLLAAFQGQTADYDVVVAPSVVIEMLEAAPTNRAQLGQDRPVLATAPLLFAVAPSRSQAVADACGDQVTWTCVAGMIQDGQLAPGIADPTRDAAGLAAFAAMTGGFLENTTYASNVFNGPEFLTWLDVIAAETQVRPAPLDQLILTGGAQNDSAIVLEHSGLATLERAAQNVPEHHWPTPLAHLSVVAVGVGGTPGGDVESVADAAAGTLAAAGWRGEGGAGPDGAPALADDDGLPAGAVLFALRERWN